ncbi:hypothetical protein HF086_015838 [Spodoptera exigua]|uniref:Uncharacterized protein n=1 Tax=Spodoptera exigua TaxID=7107 RepID=A0A922SA43_SPOEX|nr:hypothetical protein HF086_015838 [Spodoptera exigua]
MQPGSQISEELDLTAVNKAAMMALPAAKKWQIYCSRRPPPGQPPPLATAPQLEEYIKALNEIADAFASQDGVPPAEACALVDGLKTALRTRAHSFTGRAHVLAHPTSIDLIAQSLDTENVKTKVAALEILGAVCLVPGGHKKVLEAMVHYQKYAGERARFQSIMNELDRSTGAYRDDLGLKTAIMSFVNAVLNYGPGEESLEFRLHLRYELLMLGIQPDVAPLEINVGEIVHLLAKEEELVAARTKAENLEKENVDLATELAKKEKQVDEQSQEREELEGVVSRLKERLERETAAHMECTERARASATRALLLEQQLNQERAERARFEKLVSEGSIPDDAKVSNLKSAVIETACTIPPPPPPPAVCAPPLPPAPPAPAPPPAPMAPMAPAIAPPRAKKNNEGSVEDLRQLGSKPRTKILTVIDGRRAQNCTILLSKLKMTDEEICRGARGNASGFRLSSLNKLADTKSSVSRNTTLLHYLVELLETQFKDILLLEEDLPHVRAAAKVCVEQLEKDVGALRTGLREVARELEYHAALPNRSHNDMFLPVMRDFHAHAVCSFTQLEDLFQLKKRTMERKQASSLLSSVGKSLGKSNGNADCNGHSDSSRDGTLTNGQKGEFDDLISALRTGDVFGDDVAKFKRSRKASKVSHKGRDSPPRGVCREDSRERQKN